MSDPPTDDNGVTYAVITNGSGPFEDGELLVCGTVPGGSVREIGYPSRKPLKWPDVDYELFGDVLDAVAFHEAERTGHPRQWVSDLGDESDGDSEGDDESDGDDTPEVFKKTEEKTCPACNGNGKSYGPQFCSHCHGDGYVTETTRIERVRE